MGYVPLIDIVFCKIFCNIQAGTRHTVIAAGLSGIF